MADAERRARLRQAIRQKRSERTGTDDRHALQRTMRNDPATALLCIGIDDATVVNNASKIVQAAQQMAKTGGVKALTKQKDSPEPPKVHPVEAEVESDEEAPPEFTLPCGET